MDTTEVRGGVLILYDLADPSETRKGPEPFGNNDGNWELERVTKDINEHKNKNDLTNRIGMMMTLELDYE